MHTEDKQHFLYNMIKEILKLPEDIANKTVSVTVGGDLIEIIANYKQEIVDIKIAKEAIEDLEMLRALLVVGINEAIKKAKEELTAELINKGIQSFFDKK